ncbi:zinc finger, CCHC-type containing protein [Tanacetum coccineum]
MLTTLKVVYVLITPMPELMEDSTVEAIRLRAKWSCGISLESKYMAEEFFLVRNFLNLGRGMTSDKGKGKEVGGPSVNMTEEGTNNTKTKQRLKSDPMRTRVVLVSKQETPSWRCWKCGKISLQRDCRFSGKKETTRMLVVRERGLRTNPKTKVDAIAWWIDSGATTHVCKDRCWFKTFEPVEDGSVLYMGDEHFAPIHGKGSVALEFSSGKIITLFNVLYVPKLRKNLVSGPVLNKCGYKQVYESDKYILSKCGVFVGFGYYNNGIFRKLLLLTTPSKMVWLKRKNRALKEMVNSMLSYSSLSEGFWGEAMVVCTAYGSKGKLWVKRVANGSSKRDEVDGTIDKFKARLVIQGFRQKEGIDYFDTYAPVARITTIRLLLALAAIHNLVIHQMDVKTAFLNGDLDEEVYMKQPEGFVMPGNEHKVCKLVKSLYGLKQAPKQWHQKFDEVVLSSGFHLNQSDKCVYSKFDNSGKGVIICLYVDDMLIFGTDQNQVDKTKKFLCHRFSMKDMEEEDKFNREDCSSVSTPMDPVEKLKPNTGKPVDQLEYSRAIGCLMYAMTSTRRLILRYAIGRDYGLSYVGYPSVLEGYSDANWINHVERLSSTEWMGVLLGGGVISWASKKQPCITGSTMESEFVTLAAAGKEV